MAKTTYEVVGWGCQPGELCELCHSNDGQVYLVAVWEGHEETSSEFPACRACVPEGTPDPIGMLFATLLALGI